MKKLFFAIGLILLFLVPIACAEAPSGQSSSEGKDFAPAPVPMVPPQPGDDNASSVVERMIVRSGNMSMVVTDVASTRDEITSLAVKLGGYVVSSRIYGGDDLRGQISIRVPDYEFDRALAELRDLAIRVGSESTDSRDVTEEYIDLQARLKNAEATENQYLTLLKKAEDVEDILKIYERLSQVQREIEQLKGQIQYLERTSAMSYIEVNLRSEASDKPLVRAGWSIVETFKSAIRGLATVGQVIGTFAIWLLIFIPVWGTILGIIIWRIRRKKRTA
ncbi:DUF4349 domain-containing protein [Chloroflexota bacterium]